MRGVALAAIAGCLGAVSAGYAMVGRGAGGPVVSYQGYGGTAIVSADGRTVTVGEFGTSCPATVRAVARESTTRVALLLRFVTPANPPPCPQAAAAMVPAQQIRLRAPLGGRKLVDGATGTATAWSSAVLRGRTLPTELVIMQSAGRQVPGPGRGGWTPIRVRGHPGRAARNLITWRENELTDSITIGAQNAQDSPQLLTTRQLIAIANSAPRKRA